MAHRIPLPNLPGVRELESGALDRSATPAPNLAGAEEVFELIVAWPGGPSAL